jgi:DNA-binding response OmpR family regulator
MQQSDSRMSAVSEDFNRGSRRRGEPGSRCPSVLVVSRDAAQRQALRSVCAASDWNAGEARDWREAVLVLSRTGADVILCDDHLRDGTWKDVLSVVAPLPESPRLIVLFDNASATQWSEVLNLGGFDVLNKPLTEAEVTRTVAAAWRNFEDHQTATERSGMWHRA